MFTQEQERTLYLKRRYFRHGTFSYLFDAYGVELACVVEQPYNDNEPFNSCIPEGVYTFQPHDSPSKGHCYVMINENLGVGIDSGLRTHCLMHKANLPEEVEGCFAVGSEFSQLTIEGVTNWGVLNSKNTFDKLMKLFDNQVYTLVIEKD